MSDTAIGFTILGIGMLVVLGVVFVIASYGGGPKGSAKPPRGVHLPLPSLLPATLSLGAALIGAGFAFRSPEQLANPFLALPGLVIFVLGILAWVRAAGHEWREVEHGSHDDASAH